MSRIFQASGTKFDVAVAIRLWPRIVEHRERMARRLGREVGFRAACVDFLDTAEIEDDSVAPPPGGVLAQLGARAIDPGVWESISETQPPKQLIQRRVILPLAEEGLSRKHGVLPPKTIVFFGPPGTGKTHFAKAIAGRLSWWFVEIVPSLLMNDGVDKMGTRLRQVMEKLHGLDEAVIFIDEFEELAASRDTADRIDRSVTNEFLKQVPLLKAQSGRLLLVCATNYIRQLDAALLRPGRLDCIIPVGPLDRDGRRTVLRHYLSRLNCGKLDLDTIVDQTAMFTPADIELLFRNVAQQAFEREYATGRDHLVTTEEVARSVVAFRPSLTDEMIEEFREDMEVYSRL